MDNKEEQKKKAEEIRKALKIKREYKNNSTDVILEEVYKKHVHKDEKDISR